MTTSNGRAMTERQEAVQDEPVIHILWINADLSWELRTAQTIWCPGIVHDLRPLTTDERVRMAVERVQLQVGGDKGLELLGVTDGVAHVRLTGGGHGCPSTQATITDAIERAVTLAAPEISAVEVEWETARPLLQIGPRPSDPALGASGR
jgi:Fe-S cluster biogenesis protein NfuA